MDINTDRSNVLVLGAGGAGLRAAIAARESGADVVVVGKRSRRDAHTVIAAGGINAALGTVDPEDSWQQHFADTFREGYQLSHPRVVEIMAREAPDAVLELADWGCAFARLPDGRLDQRYFGAHTYRRTCYAGDQTGHEIIQTLADRAEGAGVRFADRHYVSSLLAADGRCFGAFAFDLHTGERTAFVADATVICTGGHTSLWHRNTSRADENWGEGMSLALRAGCRLMDMELVQFHPTGIVAPEDVAGTLVTEAVRGEGGLLTNALGERFMERYDPERMELSTRDRVALANYTEILEGRGGPNGGVFLDISHRGKDYIVEKLPRMYRQFLAFQGLDISKDPMEVAPTAHYSMGGISVEAETHATELDRLFAAGECASGLHGANRLGGNSLVDILIFGRRAGTAAAAFREDRLPDPPNGVVAAADEELSRLSKPGSRSARELQQRLRELMWTNAGVVRDERRLAQAVEALSELRSVLSAAGPDPEDRQGPGRILDLRAGLDTAEATLRGALVRTETRGCHNRSDHPKLDPALVDNSYVRRDDEGTMSVETRPVPPVPEELRDWARIEPVAETAEHLLE
jgi:succinate dehydrogenase / fumarate reductase flavoprotein subunit